MSDKNPALVGLEAGDLVYVFGGGVSSTITPYTFVKYMRSGEHAKLMSPYGHALTFRVRTGWQAGGHRYSRAHASKPTPQIEERYRRQQAGSQLRNVGHRLDRLTQIPKHVTTAELETLAALAIQLHVQLEAAFKPPQEVSDREEQTDG